MGHNWKIALSYILKSCWKKHKDKKIVKKELIEFIIENNEIAEPGFKEKVQNKIDITEAIIMMKRYREIMQM